MILLLFAPVPPLSTATNQRVTLLHCLSIVENKNFTELFPKGPKYREPKPFIWKRNFTLITDSVEDYARRWAKEEEV